MIYYRKTLFGSGPKLTAVQNGDADVKLYFLKGDELAEKVKEKKLTDIEARTQWQTLYVRLSNQEDVASAAAAQNYNAMRVRQTYCVPVGNSVQCSSY